jgi:hypothetical protein
LHKLFPRAMQAIQQRDDSLKAKENLEARDENLG